MNEDHADAVLAIARVYGGAPEATVARMSAITPVRLDIETGPPDDIRHLTILLDPPIRPLDTVRARLVSMTRSARAVLADPET